MEEARNRKGISIREASESTKIRGDYLSAFESGNFDLKLPEVYLRGFIRVYARFLGIDPESAVSDLSLELGVSQNKSAKKPLGTISNHDANEVKRDQPTVSSNSTNKTGRSFLSPNLMLVSLSLVGFLLVVIAIIFISKSPDPNATEGSIEHTSAPSVRETESIASSQNILEQNLVQSVSAERMLTLAAIGPIDRLIISDEGRTPKIFHEFKNLSSGWEKTIPFTTSFRCYSSSLENIRFAVDGGAEKQVSGQGAGNFRWIP